MQFGRTGDPLRLVVIGAGAAMVAAAYSYQFNDNLLFLSMLLGAHVWMAASITRTRTALAMLIVVGVMAFAPQEIRVPAFIDPARVDDRSRFTASIPHGTTWRYQFTLTRLEGHRSRCGPLTPTLIVQGARLTASSVQLRLDGAAIAKPTIFRKGDAEIRITPALDGVRQFSLSVTAVEDNPGIRVGPEIVGNTIYSDAVFLQLQNDNCTVLYHTLRAAVPSAAAVTD